MRPQRPQDDGTQRLLRALAVLGAVTFLVWGVWMTAAFLLGATGWVANAIGDALQTAMRVMTSVHGTVAAVAAGAGLVLALLLAFDVPVDRIWSRARRSRTARENP